MKHAKVGPIVLVLTLLSFGAPSGAQHAPDASAIKAESLRADVFFLAAPEMAGRDSLSVEGRIASNYIAAELMRLGLKPPANGTYFQNFPMTSASLDRENTKLVARWGAREKTFQMGTDWNYTGQSNTPAGVTGGVVFAGYGATAPEYDYDDYAGLDVSGKVVMVLTHEPQESNPASRFKGTWHTLHAYNRNKIENARRHGAGGLLIVNEWTTHRPPMVPSGPRPTGELPSFALASSYLDTPTFTITRETANEILRPSGGTIELLKQAIDASGRPGSQSLDGVTVSMTRATKDRKVVQTRNVMGLLEGSDPQLKSEVVLVTAHYDHVGTASGRIYHGADDNASGTAGVLEIARAFARSEARPKRSVLFLVFEAEERGLLGAFQYVATPSVPIDKTVAVLNMDMIGRDEDSPTWNTKGSDNVNGVNVVGTLYNSVLRKIIDEQNAAVGLKLDYKTDTDDRESWFSRSDHFPFAAANVPMVLFNTGEHPDYHTENDTWDRIHYEKMERIVRLVYLAAWDIANRKDRIPFEKGGRSPS